MTSAVTYRKPLWLLQEKFQDSLFGLCNQSMNAVEGCKALALSSSDELWEAVQDEKVIYGLLLAQNH